MPIYLVERRYPDGRVEHFPLEYPDGVTFEEGVTTLDDPDTGASWRIARIAHREGYAALLVCEPA